MYRNPRGGTMSDETRKDQEKKEELTEKDLEKASGGHVPSADKPDHIEPDFRRR
jgi:hypothetical protein